MKKNFIKVSVICALTLASSTAVVSCSDYDDDIKNHQEQIDALKKQLDASKTEITEGLNTAIEGLKAEITEIAGSKADAASVKALEQKAAELQQALDSKASNEQIAALSEEVKGLINDVNTELSAAMEETKTSLEGQISTLQQKQDELNKKIEGLDNSEEIATIQSELEKVIADLTKAQNDLKTILDANYGEKIAELQTKVTNLEGLEAQVNAYTDEQIKTLDTKLTGEITAAIADVKALIPEDLAGKLTSLENKFADYVTVNQLKEVTDMIGDLSVFEGETLVAVLKGKADASVLTDVSKRVADLEKEFEEGGSIEAIKTSIETLRTDVKKMLGVMVQSIMYVPTYSTNGVEQQIVFKTLYAHAKGQTSGDGVKIAENITDKVTFRVTPASAAEDFNKLYDIAFEGEKATRAAQTNYLSATYNEKESNIEKGLITYDITRNANSFANNTAYVLCAHIVPKSGVEANKDNYTDVSSDFFYAGHKEQHINNITVVSKLGNGTHEIEWNDGDKSYDAGKSRLSAYDFRNGVNINNLETEYGNVFKVTYAMKHDCQAPYPFTVDANGIVKIADPTASTTIDKEDYVVATATPNGTNFNYATELSNIKFKSVKELKEYSGQPITVKWLDVATSAKSVLLDLEPIARAFGMQVSDLQNIIKNSTRSDNSSIFGTATTGDQNVTVSYPSNGIKITIAKYANLTQDQTLTIKLTDKTGSTTQSGSEYKININISSTQYPEFTLQKQTAVWSSDKKSVEITPTFTNDPSQGNKINTMNLKVDVTAIYANYNQSKATIEQTNRGYITIYTPTNSDVTGVQGVSYNSLINNNHYMTITQSAYNGKAISAQTKILVNRGGNGNDITKYDDKFTFNVQKLAGTFVNEAPSTIRFEKKSDIKQLTGLSWKDYLGRAMWTDGVIQTYNASSRPNADFAVNPLSDAIYALGNAPTYSLKQANDYLQVNATTGKITLKDKTMTFVNDYTAKLVVKINGTRWGAIKGLENATFNSNDGAFGSYTLEFNVVVPAGIQ